MINMIKMRDLFEGRKTASDITTNKKLQQIINATVSSIEYGHNDFGYIINLTVKGVPEARKLFKKWILEVRNDRNEFESDEDFQYAIDTIKGALDRILK